MSLALSEHQSGVELRVERGDNGLLMSVVDENNEPIQGEHHLQISLTGYKAYSQPIDIKQSGQRLKVSLLRN